MENRLKKINKNNTTNISNILKLIKISQKLLTFGKVCSIIHRTVNRVETLKVSIVTQARQGICYILPSGLYCENYIDNFGK